MMKTVEHIPMGPWPVLVGFTDNAKAFNREMKRVDCKGLQFQLNGTCLATTNCLYDSDGVNYYIVSFSPDIKPENLPSVVAHEAWHVVEGIYDYVGEEKFGSEATAYLIQYLVEFMYKGLMDGRAT